MTLSVKPKTLQACHNGFAGVPEKFQPGRGVTVPGRDEKGTNSMRRLGKPIEFDNLPVQNHIEITGYLEDALPVIRERLGGAPKSLHETDGEPITFDTRKKGKRSGWVYVVRKPDGWLLTCGDAGGGVQHTIFVRGVARDILPPAPKQKDNGAAERAAQAAQKANNLWKLARPAGDDHPYLTRKGVKPTDTLRELSVERIREIIGYHPHAGDEPLEGRILIAPVVIGDKISTVELIGEQGLKSALKDGRKSGGYWATGALPETGRLILAEGVATALSIAEALGEPVVAALSVGNLEKVGRALQRPGRELVIAADLGEGGKPHSDAIEAARKLGARLCAPPSGMGKGADFNDLHVRDGLDAVRAAFERPIPAVEPAGQDAGGTPLSVSVCLTEEHPLPSEQPFPVEVLPELIREAVQEVQDYTQAPTALVAASALSAVSIAVQALADVQVNWMMQRPISLFLVVIAESGERKTTCDRYFTASLREFEQEAGEEAQRKLKDYNARIAAWEARREGLLKAVQKAGRDGTGLGSSPEEQALIELEHQKPQKPPVPRLLYTDATTEALAYSLAHWWPSAGLVTSDAGAVFGSYSMGANTIVRHLALLSQLWDGVDLYVDRRSKESFCLQGVRLTVGLQVQPAVIHQFMDGHGAISRGQGFWARCLICQPKSTQGTRITKDPPSRTPGLDAFNWRLRSLLEMPLPIHKKGLKPPALCLAPKAGEYWKDYSNRTERRLLGDLRGVRDVGCKAAEHVARLAAVMYLFEEGDTTGDIGEEYIERAAHIVDWYLLEARRFSEETTGAIDLSDAARLKRWLRGYCTDHKTDHVTCRTARNYGPIREKERFFAAVNQLVDDGDACVQIEGRRHVLRVNPTLLHD